MGRLRTNTDAPQLVQKYDNYIDVDKYKPNKGVLHLEIGCGKGDFLISQAINNPKIFYLGIEKYSTVVLKALKKIVRKKLVLPNLLFCVADANKLIDDKFKNKFEKLYLNFSDPWPKKRHAKRRLTSPSFLEIYKKILKNNAIVEFKTDNDAMYEYSLGVLNSRKDVIVAYSINDMYGDITNIYNINNIQTEYEKKFVSQSKNINKIVFKFK